MTVGDIKDLVMFQTNNDVDDIGDFLPFMHTYIDDAYDRLVYAWDKKHPGTEYQEIEDYPMLVEDTDEPTLPEWTHKAIADWATWCVYRNGNQQKQNRGMAFRQAFEETISKIISMGGKSGYETAVATGDGSGVKNFFNIPD